MGTRSMIYVLEEDNSPLVALYGQYDGHPTEGGIGHDLYNLFANLGADRKFDSYRQRSVTCPNDINDIAAQVVCYLKNQSPTYNFYIYPIRKLPTKKQTYESYRDKVLVKYAAGCMCEYIYIIKARGFRSEINLQVLDCGGEILFDGEPKNLIDTFHYEDLSEVLTADDTKLYKVARCEKEAPASAVA